MKLTRLVLLLAGALIVASNVWAQTPSPAPSPSPLSAEERAAREKRLAERRAEMRKREEANKARRAAQAAKRTEELKARRAQEATEREARQVKRAEEQKVRTAKQSAERQANAVKRAAEREATARKRAAEAEKRRSLNDGTFRFLSSRMNASFARVVKGAPYSAVAVTEFVQKFVDGNQILRRNEAAFYRDSEGRMRVEQRLSTIGKWSAAGDAPRIIMIGDPVSGEYYDLDPRTKTAVKNVGLGKRLQEQRLRQEQNAVQSGKPTVEQQASLSSDGRRRTESLGSQRIEGVEAQGKRTTNTIPAGEIGNTLPIETTEESWFSSELQMVVMTKRHDPRSGDTTYRLTNISRREPERSLFQVPSDYTIVDRSVPKPAPKPAQQKTGTVKEKTSKSEKEKTSKSEKEKTSKSQIFD